MLNRRLSILPLAGICISALFSAIADAQELQSSTTRIGGEPPVTAELQSAPLEAFHRYAHTLHELSQRRRSTVLFPNQQSILRGAQVGFVNVGDGNLTFARRDLVVVGLLPIVMARVYDSSAAETGDLGPGWRLSIAETISPQADGTLLLIDESGSTTRYAEHNGQYIQAVPHPTDIVSFTQRNRYVLLIKLSSGIEKRYQLIDGLYRLSRMTDRNDNQIRLRYRKGRLARLEGENDRAVLIDRDRAGRIEKVTDELGRSVSYNYGPQGRLTRVIDLGGNAWNYTYGIDGLLSSALDPLGYVDISVEYDDERRVAEVVHRGQEARYQYDGYTSRVLDHRDRVSSFTQDEAGITVAVNNHVGVTTRLVLDERNRVSELHRNEATKAMFSYDAEGRLLSSRQATDDGLRTIAYAYDGAGRLKSASDDTGFVRLTLRYYPNGNVRLVERKEERTIYRHGANGALEGLVRPDGKRYKFETDADGQITKVIDQDNQVIELSYFPAGTLEQIRFPDGSTHTYGYESNGLRSFIQPSDAKLLRTYYSASGNMTLLEHVSSTGAIESDYYEYDETNRLNRITFEHPMGGDTSTSVREVRYDQAGKVVRETAPTADVQFSYDDQDRLVAVADGSKRLAYTYTEDEPDIRLQLDHETQINLLPWSNSGTTIGTAYEIISNRARLTPYRTVQLDDYLEVFRLVSDIAVVLPNEVIEESLSRMRLLTLSNATFDEKAHFSRPSNVVFTPKEFRSINCHVKRCNGFVPRIDSAAVPASAMEADLEPGLQCWGTGGDGSNTCGDASAVDSAAIAWLKAVPSPEPFERGRPIWCKEFQGNTYRPVSTNETRSGDDPCIVGIAIVPDLLAGSHTHPFFRSASEADGCFSQTHIRSDAVDGINEDNFQFGSDDAQYVTKNPKKPLYMRVPEADEIYVLPLSGPPRRVWVKP